MYQSMVAREVAHVVVGILIASTMAFAGLAGCKTRGERTSDSATLSTGPSADGNNNAQAGDRTYESANRTVADDENGHLKSVAFVSGRATATDANGNPTDEGTDGALKQGSRLFFFSNPSKGTLKCPWAQIATKTVRCNVGHLVADLTFTIKDTALPPPAKVDVNIELIYGTFPGEALGQGAAIVSGLNAFDLKGFRDFGGGRHTFQFLAEIPYQQGTGPRDIKARIGLNNFAVDALQSPNGVFPAAEPQLSIKRNFPHVEGTQIFVGPQNAATYAGTVKLSTL